MTIDTAISELAECKLPRDYLAIHKKLEIEFTPLDLANLCARKSELPPFSRDWLEGVVALCGSTGKTTERYRRNELATSVELYADPDVGRAQKSLIIGFTGSAHRLAMPIAAVLQHLPSSHFDLLLLKDTTRSQFANGIPEVSRSFLGLITWIQTRGRLGEYAKVYTLGNSLGGFAALRYGMKLDAVRAVSFGGRFPAHARRLAATSVEPIPAFDPLCACAPLPTGELVCVFGADCAQDRHEVEMLSRFIPIRLVAVPDLAEHGIVVHLARRQQLGHLFAEMFDFI